MLPILYRKKEEKVNSFFEKNQKNFQQKIEKVNAPPEMRPSAFSFTKRRGCIEFDKKDELRLACPKRILPIIILLVL